MVEPFLNAPLAPHTTLNAGGSADELYFVHTPSDLVEIAEQAHRTGRDLTVLGHGSNVLPADAGVAGMTVVNITSRIDLHDDGAVEADSGVSYQELFLKAAQAGLSGIQFAVGIPGTIGGALASNAGAYRNQTSDVLTEVYVVEDGGARWEPASYLQLSYRDSVFRKEPHRKITVVRLRMRLQRDDPKRIYAEAREWQRQRILKQPPVASAGSFFKNVEDRELAAQIARLPEALKQKGIVPAGYLLDEAGMMGCRIGGAMVSRRHANFFLNVGGASASDLRNLAELAKTRVWEKFGQRLQEEVLYIGRWEGWRPQLP